MDRLFRFGGLPTASICLTLCDREQLLLLPIKSSRVKSPRTIFDCQLPEVLTRCQAVIMQVIRWPGWHCNRGWFLGLQDWRDYVLEQLCDVCISMIVLILLPFFFEVFFTWVVLDWSYNYHANMYQQLTPIKNYGKNKQTYLQSTNSIYAFVCIHSDNQFILVCISPKHTKG